MPELPDLQVFSRNLHKALSGKKVNKLTFIKTTKLKHSPAAFTRAVKGAILQEVYREGKELRFKFSKHTVIGVHLMLNGKFSYFSEKNESRNTIMEMLFSDGSGLALTDQRGLATVTLNPVEDDVPDALSADLTLPYFHELISKKRLAIKKVLMDQHLIKGIGNAYADEILYRAGISPFSISNKIPPRKVGVLFKMIGKVLKDAEKQMRKQHPDLIGGEIRDFLQVHVAHQEHTPHGELIKQKSLNGRSTYFTDKQELYE